MIYQMTYFQTVVTVVACLFLLAFGVLSLVWPEKIQAYALRRSTKFYFWPNLFLGWMKTSGYLVYLRFMGVVCLGMGLCVLLVALMGRK